jgi:hypothetical protein
MRPTIAEDSIPKFQFRAGIRWYAASTIKAYGTGTSWPWPARSIAGRLYRQHGHSEASSGGSSRNTSRPRSPTGITGIPTEPPAPDHPRPVTLVSKAAMLKLPPANHPFVEARRHRRRTSSRSTSQVVSIRESGWEFWSGRNRKGTVDRRTLWRVLKSRLELQRVCYFEAKWGKRYG